MIYLICLSAALAFAVGNILQKKGLHQNRIDHPDFRAMVWATLKDVPWWGGILLSLVGTLAYYYGMAKWPLSQVQSLLSLNPVMTALLGVIFLKEKYDKSTIWGISMVLVGVLTVNLSPDPGESSQGTLFWFLSTLILLTLLGVTLWGVFPQLFGQIQEGKPLAQRYKRSEWIFSLMTGLGFGLSAVYYKAFSLSFDPDLPLQGLNTSALLLGFLYFISYAIGFFSSQAALSYGRALFVVPFSAAIGTMVPILGGILILGEDSHPIRWLGVIFIAFALFLFVPRGDFSNIHNT